MRIFISILVTIFGFGLSSASASETHDSLPAAACGDLVFSKTDKNNTVYLLQVFYAQKLPAKVLWNGEYAHIDVRVYLNAGDPSVKEQLDKYARSGDQPQKSIVCVSGTRDPFWDGSLGDMSSSVIQVDKISYQKSEIVGNGQDPKSFDGCGERRYPLYPANDWLCTRVYNSYWMDPMGRGGPVQ